MKGGMISPIAGEIGSYRVDFDVKNGFCMSEFALELQLLIYIGIKSNAPILETPH